MCTVTICFPVCNIKNMLIKPFPIWSKKSEQNFKYDQDVMRFLGEVKSICSHCKGAISYQKLPWA